MNLSNSFNYIGVTSKNVASLIEFNLIRNGLRVNYIQKFNRLCSVYIKQALQEELSYDNFLDSLNGTDRADVTLYPLPARRLFILNMWYWVKMPLGYIEALNELSFTVTNLIPRTEAMINYGLSKISSRAQEDYRNCVVALINDRPYDLPELSLAPLGFKTVATNDVESILRSHKSVIRNAVKRYGCCDDDVVKLIPIVFDILCKGNRLVSDKAYVKVEVLASFLDNFEMTPNFIRLKRTTLPPLVEDLVERLHSIVKTTITSLTYNKKMY